MVELRQNMAKRKLEQGKVVTSVAGENTPDIIDFLGTFGFDSIWIECEHGSVGWSQIADMTRACDLWDMGSIVRVNTNEPWLIGRTLDRGASGIVVPHVNTKEDALKVVEGAKFGPLGHRGMYAGRRSFGVSEYHSKINSEILIVVLIEEMEAIENLQEILTVDEIDVFFLAPGDLAQTMGLTGQPSHPEVSKVIDKAISDIISAGRVPGTLVTNDTMEDYIRKGVRFLNVQWNNWMASGAEEHLSRMRSASL